MGSFIAATADYLWIFLLTAAALILSLTILIIYIKSGRLNTKGNMIATELLETERLILRRFNVSDAEEMYESWANDAEVTEYLTWTAHKSIQNTIAVLREWENGYREGNLNNWAIVVKENGKLIGSIGLKEMDASAAELGYVLAKAYWGKGLMPEAASRVIAHSFKKLGYIKIAAKHFSENSKSGRVMQKIGMRKLEATEQTEDSKGDMRTVVKYILSKRDFIG